MFLYLCIVLFLHHSSSFATRSERNYPHCLVPYSLSYLASCWSMLQTHRKYILILKMLKKEAIFQSTVCHYVGSLRADTTNKIKQNTSKQREQNRTNKQKFLKKKLYKQTNSHTKKKKNFYPSIYVLLVLISFKVIYYLIAAKLFVQGYILQGGHL